MRMVSACLLGIKCAWDGRDRYRNKKVIELLRKEILIPVCPEQLGGLATPRTPAEIVGGDGDDVLDGRARVVDESGRDVTEAFLRGARETVALCRILGIDEVLLKSRSPSCGVDQVYHGTELVEGDGVTAAFLRREGIRTIRHPD